MKEICELCGCDAASSFHHLIPRTLHKNKWFKKRYTRKQLQSGIDVCGDCQRAIHDLIPDEKEMGRYYGTMEELLSHPQVARYVGWKRKRSRQGSDRER
jgi:hypothetical protein